MTNKPQAKTLFGFDLSIIQDKTERGFQELIHALTCIFSETKTNRLAGEKTARILAFEFGETPSDSDRFSPRSLARLPVIVEPENEAASPTEKHEIHLEELNQGRLCSRGYVGNIGGSAFRVVFYGVGGNASPALTVPTGGAVAMTWAVSQVDILPIGGHAAYFQVLAQ